MCTESSRGFKYSRHLRITTNTSAWLHLREKNEWWVEKSVLFQKLGWLKHWALLQLTINIGSLRRMQALRAYAHKFYPLRAHWPANREEERHEAESRRERDKIEGRECPRLPYCHDYHCDNYHSHYDHQYATTATTAIATTPPLPVVQLLPTAASANVVLQ